MRKLRKGDVVRVRQDDLILGGATGVIVHRSQRTSNLTVKLVLDHNAYKKGAEVQLQPYEVVLATETR